MAKPRVKMGRIAEALAGASLTSTELAALIGGTRHQMTVLLMFMRDAGLVRKVGTRANRRGPPSALWTAVGQTHTIAA